MRYFFVHAMDNFPNDFVETKDIKNLASIIRCWRNKMKTKCKYHPVKEEMIWKYCPDILKIKENQYIEDWKIPNFFF